MSLLFLAAGVVLLAIVAYFIGDISRQLGALTAAVNLASEQVATTATVVPAGDNKQENTNALRLQAYERLTLMLERINVPNVLLRLPPDGTGVSAKAYTAMLLMAIREDFEYNVTQQIYVSDALWSIVNQARDNVSQLIVRAAEGADTAEQVASRLRLMSSRQPENAIGVGQAAIRREASLVLG